MFALTMLYNCLGDMIDGASPSLKIQSVRIAWSILKPLDKI